MDETDDALIALLRQNARMPVASLAQALGLARSTVQSRLERLERKGIIAGYTVRLGDAADRQTIRATALLQIEPRTLPAVLSRLKAMHEVDSAHTTSGRFDLIVALSARSTAALDAALDAIGAVPGVRSSESLVHLSTRIDRAP
ncbi:MAG: Lrp/AsnC family transcriptional regulator [Silicimonas sp.]|nr:Lrp/AsnC family transcriptional regulator [Silicimonas sp.]